MSIYKACDIRGTYGDDLTDDTALMIARAVGSKLTGKKVVVGGDVRVSTPALRKAVIDGLVNSGCHVLDLGVVPTPAFYFAKSYLRADGGMMVTASHNPPQFNGFKVILGNLPITPEEIDEIEVLAQSKDFVEANGQLEHIDVVDIYKDSIMSRFKPARGFRVVVDAANGCYSDIAPSVLRELGYDVVPTCCEVDGNFPCHPPNPAVKDNLRHLSRKVMEASADIGVGFDCDGDRVVFVDERGEVVETDVSIVIFAKHLLDGRPGGKVVYDLKCSSIVPEEVLGAGGVPIMEKSGHAFIKRRVMEERAVLGGEVSGHFFYDFFDGGDDGLYSSILMMEIMSRAGEPLSALASAVPRYCTTPDIRVPYDGNDTLELLERIRDGISGCELSELDGIRAVFSEGWGLARASISEPVLTFRFEARRAEDLSCVMDRFLTPVPHVRRLVYEEYSQS